VIIWGRCQVGDFLVWAAWKPNSVPPSVSSQQSLFSSSSSLPFCTSPAASMAPSREESHASDKHDPPLQQLIFSCQVCHATVSELYSRPEPNLNPQTRQEDGLMINLWMASCAHLICSKHLEGGGPSTQTFMMP
jgi:hypothetical protein